MSSTPDAIVVGAGPAGIGAALAASEHGVETVLIDAAPAAGGQVYRAPPSSFLTTAVTRKDADFLAGEVLRARLAKSTVTHVAAHQVWSVGTDLRVDAISARGPVSFRPRAIVAATGAIERVVPFAGWTLPGVIGLAAATVLLKSQHVLPGARTLVAGAGPLLYAVAHKILRSGGHVQGVVDASAPADWARGLGAMMLRPSDLLRGLSWWRELRKARVPLLARHAISAVSEGSSGLTIEVSAVDAKQRFCSASGPGPTFQADCVTVGNGLVPASELTRSLGARHVFDDGVGGWVPALDRSQRTSRASVYAAGDGAGIAGAAAAYHAGRLAGLTLAFDRGRIDSAAWRSQSAPVRRALFRARRFGAGLVRRMAVPSERIACIPPDVVVCRCEDVTRREIEEALAAGAGDVHQIKSWTRCGMGPCQGRVCGDIVAAIAALRLGDRETAGVWTARAPLAPIGVEALTGEFAYADIPIPEAAPP